MIPVARTAGTTAPRHEQGHAETPEGQLLDGRGHEGDDEEEGDEGAGAARIPPVGDQPLLLRGVEIAEQGQDLLVHERDAVDREQGEHREPDRASPGLRATKREHLAFRETACNEEQDPEHEGVLNERGDRRRVPIRDVVGRVDVGQPGAVGE